MAAVFLKKSERVTWKLIFGAVLIVGGTVLLAIFPDARVR
jgi:drug/metabolite transporter (DMT)-like permease